MRYLHHLSLLSLAIVPVISAAPPAAETPKSAAKPSIYANPQEAFRDLLNALPESSLRVALNSLNGFRPGVFESDRHGVEQVHQENPPLATKLIVAAVQDLKKRQSPPSNGTVTQNPPPPSKTPEESKAPESSKQPPAVPVPITITQTNDKGEPTVIASHILSEPTATAVVTDTVVDEKGSTFVTTATKPAVVEVHSDSAGVHTTTKAVDFAPTPGQKLTTTNDKGSVFVTTYTPGGGRVSSIKLITTTGENGQQLVVTSYTYVDPVPTGPAGEGQPTGENGTPKLQNGAAKVGGVVGAATAVLAGVVGGVVLMLG